jgi:serine protease DegS
VIISVNDKPAVSALETMDQVAEIRPGSEIPVVIMRDDKKLRCISPFRNIRTN